MWDMGTAVAGTIIGTTNCFEFILFRLTWTSIILYYIILNIINYNVLIILYNYIIYLFSLTEKCHLGLELYM